MKRPVILIGVFCAVVIACIFLWRKPSSRHGAITRQDQIRHEQAADAMEPVKPSPHKNEVIPPTVVAPQDPQAKYNPTDFNGATTDPAAMEFLSRMKTWSDLGEVRSTAKGTQQLWLGDRMVIEAKSIKPGRTIAANGTIVVAVATESVASLPPGERPDTSDLPSSIWAVDIQGHAKRISQLNEVADAPLISPDGKKVAFVVSGPGIDGIPERARLVVTNLMTNETRFFRSNQPLDEYRVSPVEWVEDGRVLKIMEDYGETGGHMVMRQIRLE